jgi:hypothetical protein
MKEWTNKSTDFLIKSKKLQTMMRVKLLKKLKSLKHGNERVLKRSNQLNRSSSYEGRIN